MTNWLPAYDELPILAGAPARSSWGVWGESDVLGTLNLQTPERALRAAQSVRSGRWFAMNLSLDLPDPPIFGRPGHRHEVTGGPGEIHDDVYHEWNTQRSSQWDGFRHFPHRQHGYYNGRPDEEHGMHHWAARGIVARGVLVDVARWRDSVDRPIRQGEADPISCDDLVECISSQGCPIEVGDVLMVRTGWLSWYRTLDRAGREEHARTPRQPGLAGRDVPAKLWNMRISALAADNGAVEMIPMAPGTGFMHADLLPLLGIPLGEMWDLDALAADCASDGRYDCLLVSAPLHMPNGVASPPNAIAIK